MKYIIRGDYFDCLYHNGCYYIWDTWGSLFAVDFEEDDHISVEERQFCTCEYDRNVMYHFVKQHVQVKGGYLPIDAVISGRYIYTAMENAIYRCGISYTSKKRNYSILDNQELLSVRGVSLAVDELGFVSIAAENDGVFEIYDRKRYAINKWEHKAKDVEPGIYQVTSRYARKVDYINGNILTTDDMWHEKVCNYEMAKRKWVDGKIRRSLINSTSDNLPMLRESNPMSSVPFDRKAVEKLYYVIRKHSVGGLLEVASLPRKMETGAFGTVTESKKEVLVELINGKIIRFDGPITRTRIFNGRNKKDLLMIVFDDRIEVTDFAEELENRQLQIARLGNGK